MKIFFQYIKNYLKADFLVLPHIVIAIFLSLCLWFNYQYDFFDTMLMSKYKQWPSVLYLWLFFSFSFIGASAIISLFQKEKKIIFNKKFVIFGLIGMLFIAFDNSYYIMTFIESSFPRDPFIRAWVSACVSNLSSFITVILPAYILYFSIKYFKPEFYGLKFNGAKVLPYLWLIFFMIPLIYMASFRPDFLHTYPTYHDNFEYKLLGVDQWMTAGLYELCYGFDFLSVELFFRGFMVIALSRFVGKDAILPMVVVYCFLHFGKPAGEAISSIFGGYILGILAYKSRNIYGGLIAHLGVAWGMEYLAYLQS